jgi:hypothetical protein
MGSIENIISREHPSGGKTIAEFYVKTKPDGKEQGPFNSIQLKKLVDQGKLKPRHLISQDHEKWTKAAKIKGLGLNTTAAPVTEAGQQESKSTCSQCGKEIDAGAVICIECGTDLSTGRQIQSETDPDETGRKNPRFAEEMQNHHGPLASRIPLKLQAMLLLGVFAVIAVSVTVYGVSAFMHKTARKAAIREALRRGKDLSRSKEMKELESFAKELAECEYQSQDLDRLRNKTLRRIANLQYASLQQTYAFVGKNTIVKEGDRKLFSRLREDLRELYRLVGEIPETENSRGELEASIKTFECKAKILEARSFLDPAGAKAASELLDEVKRNNPDHPDLENISADVQAIITCLESAKRFEEKGDRESVDWWNARARNTLDDYIRFSQAHPDGKYKHEVWPRIKPLIKGVALKCSNTSLEWHLNKTFRKLQERFPKFARDEHDALFTVEFLPNPLYVAKINGEQTFLGSTSYSIRLQVKGHTVAKVKDVCHFSMKVSEAVKKCRARDTQEELRIAAGDVGYGDVGQGRGSSRIRKSCAPYFKEGKIYFDKKGTRYIDITGFANRFMCKRIDFKGFFIAMYSTPETIFQTVISFTREGITTAAAKYAYNKLDELKPGWEHSQEARDARKHFFAFLFRNPKNRTIPEILNRIDPGWNRTEEMKKFMAVQIRRLLPNSMHDALVDRESKYYRKIYDFDIEPFLRAIDPEWHKSDVARQAVPEMLTTISEARDYFDQAIAIVERIEPDWRKLPVVRDRIVPRVRARLEKNPSENELKILCATADKSVVGKLIAFMKTPEDKKFPRDARICVLDVLKKYATPDHLDQVMGIAHVFKWKEYQPAFISIIRKIDKHKIESLVPYLNSSRPQRDIVRKVLVSYGKEAVPCLRRAVSKKIILESQAAPIIERINNGEESQK